MYNIYDSWGYTLSKIAQKLNENFTERLYMYNIDSREYGALSIVYDTPRLTQKEIGEKMVVDRTTMVQLIDSLESKELITRESNPKDRRQNLISLTKKGQEIVEKMWIELEQVEKEVIKTLPTVQKEILESINTYIKENENE